MIYNEVSQDDIIIDGGANATEKKEIKRKNIYKFIIVFFITAILSTITLSTNIYPIGYVMLGVASAFNVPLLVIAAISVLFMAIFKVGMEVIIPYVCFFVIFTLVAAILNIRGLTKKYAILMKMMISLALVELVQALFLSHSFFELLVYVFSVSTIYLVFVHGISVIINIRKGYVFTEEERISALCILAFILSIFSDINILGVYLTNIVAIMTVLIYGYRHGAVAGCVSGFIIGIIICITSNINIAFLATLGAGGLISGIMNKIGKAATVIGFIIGSALVSYLSSNFAYYTTNIIEIVIAAIPVLTIPKKAIKKVEQFFNINRSLDMPYSNLLEPSKEAKEKLNAISNAINDIASYDISYTKEDKIEFRDVLKKYINDYLENVESKVNNREGLDLEEEKLDICIDYISTKLESGDEISEDMIMFDCENKKEMISNLKDIYNSVKIMRILKRKEMEIHEKCTSEYKEISNMISGVANNISRKMPVVNSKNIKSIREELKMLGYPIYEDELVIENDYVEYTFITDILADIDVQKAEIVKAVSGALDKSMTVRLLLNISKTEKSKIKLASITHYIVETSAVQKTKDNSEINGDSHLCMNFGIGKYISVISDGAGSGESANESSKVVINTLEKLIKAGFDESKASEIVNNIIKLRQDENQFASLDIAIFDLETADSSFIKFGAAPTYILSDSKVTSINSMNIPVGIINEAEYVPIVKKLNNNDIVLQISDGALLKENNIHENCLTSILSKVNISLSPKSIASNILNELIKKSEKGIEDDITIVVNKVMASKSKVL